MIKEKIESRKGLSRLAAILLVAVIAMCVWFIAEAYQKHLHDARMTFDQDQVNVALRNARVQYLTDGCPAGITYYYDAENATFRSFDEVNLIHGYGRCYESENLHGETGAVGIPNRGGPDGAQFLAIAFEDGDHCVIRWQGRFLTPYDMELMSTAEQARLTTEQLQQIEISRQRELEQAQGERK